MTQEQAALAQQQAMAQRMMEEGSAPIDPGRQAGGWVIPISPLEGLTHVGKQLAGAMMQRNIAKQQSELGQKQLQAMLGLLRGGGAAPPPANPMDPASATPSVMAGSGEQPFMPSAAPTAVPAGAAGVDTSKLMQLYAANQLFGPAAGSLMAEQFKPTDLQKNIGAAGYAPGSPQAQAAYQHTLNPPINVRPGGTVYVPGQGPQYIAPNLPMGSAPINPQNPAAGVQAIPGVTDVLAGNKAAEARSVQPFGMQTMKVPVYLPGGDQTEVNLNPVQAEHYNRTGQLPPEIAASIPGYQPPPPAQQQPMGTVAPPQPGTPDYEAYQQVRSAKVPTVAYVPQGPASAGGRPVVGRGQTQAEQITQQRQTSAGKAVDELFAKDYVAFTTGGAQDAAKQLAQLQDVVGELSNPTANLTGPVIGRTPDTVKSFTNPKSIAMRERVEEVVQRSLRAILGAQFTEKEGERLIARAYNPNLPERENAVRVNRLATQLQQAFDAKQSAAQYFERNNTLQGWGGKTPTIADFDPVGKAKEGAQGAPKAPMYAVNPTTGERIMSTDGGQTWGAAK